VILGFERKHLTHMLAVFSSIGDAHWRQGMVWNVARLSCSIGMHFDIFGDRKKKVFPLFEIEK